LLPKLESPIVYRTVIDGLEKKWAKRGRLDRLEIGDLTLVELRSQKAELARRLANTVGSGDYRLGVLVARRGRFDGKERVIHRPNLLDAIVLTVLARYLSELFEPALSPTLHSYRKGHSSWKTLELLRDYLVVYRGAVTVRERGLYVMRRDVAKYGESIDVSDDSPLFGELRRLLASDSNECRQAIVTQLVLSALRQPVLGEDGTVKALERGIPTGSPIQPPFLNLYLSAVDRQFAGISGGFHARFGDDILFLHPDANCVTQMCEWFENRLAALRLTSKLEKHQDLYFNAAGRPAPVNVPFRATQQLEYLGARVSFDGNLGLKNEQFRRLLRLLHARLRRIAHETLQFDRDERIQLLCEATQRALAPNDALALPGVDRLHACLNDRSQMKDFDYRVALSIAEFVTGRRGVRAFRELSVKTQRKFGAYSLVLARQRAARKIEGSR
jgi:hypothetical protein